MNLLKKIAPILSTALSLGGPLGAMAGAAINKTLGSKAEATVEGVASALAGGTPEQLAAVQAAEQQFQLDMQKLGFQNAEDLAQLAEQDTASARAREVSVRDKIPAVLAISITLGFFVMLGLMMKWPPPAQNKDLINIMLGSLGTAWIAVVGYYFGSSAGSDKKNEIIAKLSE